MDTNINQEGTKPPLAQRKGSTNAAALSKQLAMNALRKTQDEGQQ